MSTPFSYGQLMPSVTKNYGSGPAEQLTAHEYKTLWYAAAADIEKLQQRIEKDAALLRQALETLELVGPSGLTGHRGIQARKQTITAIRQHLGETE